MTDEKELAQRLIVECQSGFLVPIGFDLPHLILMVGAIQVALRHPALQPGGKNAESGVKLAGMVECMIEMVEAAGLTAAVEVMRMGMDPACDRIILPVNDTPSQSGGLN